ncbi:phage baseplate assembly protein V [Campylobacter sp. MIT 99-7217]|uniref:phage baseplate assembly protein V n=1 Tax=Campylobacter sp. MIT 99-7217 TaxID=535091 RepID=UPI001157F4E7|nr:phage baseplate assembly protein V [Campylobacter sp. MIT 99-7217]TQR29156.1 phage baseplate assembly protein V [Campylobacter sp. MIT 99-7217]
MNELGIICDIKGDKARVAIGEMVTDYLSVFACMANSYAVSFCPLRIGEQVLVMPVRGDLNSGVILRGLYQEKHSPKNTDNNTFNIHFEDGTHLEYNSQTSTLKLDVSKNINITCVDKFINAQNHTTKANTISLKASNVSVEATSISLNGNTQIAGGISTSGKGGGSGSFSINGNLNLIGNLQVSGQISDSKGDLTNHTHACTCGATASPR